MAAAFTHSLIHSFISLGARPRAGSWGGGCNMVTVSPPAQAVRQVGGSEVTHHFQVPRCGEARSPEKGPLGKRGR